MDRNQDEGGRWLAEARRDLQAARLNLTHGIYEDACFKAQQAGEMALKAYLYARGERNVVGHSLLSLAQRIARTYATRFSRAYPDCRELDRHYIQSRYPNGWAAGPAFEHYDRPQALRALKAAGRLLRAVSSANPKAS